MSRPTRARALRPPAPVVALAAVLALARVVLDSPPSSAESSRALDRALPAANLPPARAPASSADASAVRAAGARDAVLPILRRPRIEPPAPLAPEVQQNLARTGLPFAPFTLAAPNIRASDPAGDRSDEAQSYVSVAAWGRFVVTTWIDTKGGDPPDSSPPFTEIGYATSCDWGATFTDGGSVPRVSAFDQCFHPTLSTDGLGHFYLGATYNSTLDVAGNPATTAVDRKSVV